MMSRNASCFRELFLRTRHQIALYWWESFKQRTSKGWNKAY